MKKTPYNPGPLVLLTLLLTLPMPGKAAWEFHENPERGSVSGRTLSTDGKVTLSFGCERWAKGIFSTFYGYQSNAIDRVDDATQNIQIVFNASDGSMLQSFAIRFHYFAPDETWVLTDQDHAPLADAWAAGSVMIFQSPSGEEVARFDLAGTSRARARFRQLCGV